MMNIEEIKLSDIQPSQFFLSNEKIRKIKLWFNPNDLSRFMPIPIKKLNGTIIFTDGHTRAFVAQSMGLTKAPLVWENEELDWDEYQICVDACKKRGINKITDLKDKILPSKDYSLRWNGWCDIMHEVLELQKSHNQTID